MLMSVNSPGLISGGVTSRIGMRRVPFIDTLTTLVSIRCCTIRAWSVVAVLNVTNSC